MATTKRRKARSLGTKAAELAIAAPQVVAHRVTRMALSGPHLSARDRKEFARMVAEKHDAFGEAWSAMAQQAVRSQLALATSLWQSLWLTPLQRRRAPGALAAQVQRAAAAIVGKGIGPVHRKALANAKRLARTKLR